MGKSLVIRHIMSKQPVHTLAKDKIKFLLLEGIHQEAVDVLNAAGYQNIEQQKTALQGSALKAALAEVHFLGIRSRSQLTAEILAAAPKLISIGCFCIGTNQVNLERAHQLGIPIFNAPYSNTRSVAELAIAEIILLMRGIPEKNAAAHRGEWLKTAHGSTEARGKTLGIIGYGHIGTQLGILAESLGIKVKYFDIASKLPLGNAEAVVSLHRLLGQCDVVSLHVPETHLTQNMLSTVELAAMKPGSFLLNLSRGTVEDIPALTSSLKSGHIAGAALDVYPEEPKNYDDEFISDLREFDQVILTPHIGGSTLEAQKNIAAEVAGKLVLYSDNGSTQSAVNFPEVSLPDNSGTHRIMHIHRNEPGVLQKINKVFSANNVNIAAQYLQTHDQLGYVVMDIETKDVKPSLDALKTIDETVRCRVIY